MAAPKGTAPAVPVTSAAELAQMPPAAVTIDITCDDEPEELDIPVDKVGLVSDFCEECRENLGQIGYQLIALEDSATPLPVVNDLFRSVHTVKGGARLLKIRKMEALTHQLESLLDQVRNGTRPVSSDLIDVLLDGKKLLEDMVDEVASRGPIRTRIGPALQTLAALQHGTTPLPTVPPAALVPMTTRLPAQTLTAEDESAKPATVEARPKATLSTESIRVPTAKLDDVLNTASEVFITCIRLQHDVAAISSAIKQFKQTLHHMSELDTQVILDRLAEANRRLIDDLRALLTRKNGYITPNQLAPLVNRFHTELSAEIDMQGFSAPQELTLNVLAIEEMHKHLQKNVELLEQLSARLQTGAMNFRMVPPPTCSTASRRKSATWAGRWARGSGLTSAVPILNWTKCSSTSLPTRCCTSSATLLTTALSRSKSGEHWANRRPGGLPYGPTTTAPTWSLRWPTMAVGFTSTQYSPRP
jgi:two-component system chemotaxis sensor kinase CheA